MAASKDDVKGYLVLSIEEASGKNKDDVFCWDSSSFEGFVKVELRGGMRAVKATTQKKPVVGTSIQWRERLVMEVLNDSEELRLMVCREKVQANKRGVSVIAACGIFVKDILDAAPIDKYFELFKPSAGGEGGYVRIGMDFVKDLKALDELTGAAKTKKPSLLGRLFKTVLFLGALGGAGYLVKTKLDEEEEKKKKATLAKAPAKPAPAPAKRW